MKIFYYFGELETPMYKWQRIHIFDELERNGIDIVSFNPLQYENMDAANTAAIEKLKKHKDIDLFLACDDQTVIHRDTVLKVKSMGIPSCLIAWDNLELPYKQKEIAPLFDVVWLTSWETRYLFESWGCKNIVFRTYAANPYFFKISLISLNPE